jgi:hypothetical protein
LAFGIVVVVVVDVEVVDVDLVGAVVDVVGAVVDVVGVVEDVTPCEATVAGAGPELSAVVQPARTTASTASTASAPALRPPPGPSAAFTLRNLFGPDFNSLAPPRESPPKG